MVVIAHQTIGMNFNLIAFDSFLQQSQIDFSIFVTKEYLFFSPAAI